VFKLTIEDAICIVLTNPKNYWDEEDISEVVLQAYNMVEEYAYLYFRSIGIENYSEIRN
jgi:hypothetical protein